MYTTYKEFPYPKDYPRIHARGRQFHKQPSMRNKIESLGKVYNNDIYINPLVQRVRYVLAHCDELTFTRESRSKPMLPVV
jgi:hypothetical protein